MEIFKTIISVFGYVFLVYSLLYSTFLVIFVLSGCKFLYSRIKKKKFKNFLDDDFYVPVSIIIPAYNEEKTIIGSVRSILNIDYKVFEIVVVDDGSHDNTSQVMIDEFKMEQINRPIHNMIECGKLEFVYESNSERVPITLVRKENRGAKADSINMGINVCRYPYFLCVDADTVLQNDALKEIVTPILEDENCIAVGGSIRILNDLNVENGVLKKYRMPKSLIAGLQVIEYDRTFSSAKIFFHQVKGQAIISGALGLFKKSIVVKVGGYDPTCYGEDMDLVVTLSRYCMENKIPYSVDYVPSAVCYTQAPEKLSDLGRQRVRWHVGMKQCLQKNRKMLFNPKYKSLGSITLPIFILFEFLSPIIEFISVIGLIVSLILGLIDVIPWLMASLMYSIFGIFASLVSSHAFLITFNIKPKFFDILKIILVCIFELVFVHWYLLVLRFYATIRSTKRKFVWKSLERKEIK